MASFEGRITQAESITSGEASRLFKDFLVSQVAILIETGAARPWTQSGKEYISVGGIPFGAEPEFEEDCYETYTQSGFISDLTICLDAVTRQPTSAYVSKDLPAQLSSDQARLWRADRVNSRLQFPRPHQLDETPRVVVDRWHLPLVSLELAATALEGTGYSEASHTAYVDQYNNIFKNKDKHCIPIGATAVSHTVYGRPGGLPDDDRLRLAMVAGEIESGVKIGLEQQRVIEAELFTESSALESSFPEWY